MDFLIFIVIVIIICIIVFLAYLAGVAKTERKYEHTIENECCYKLSNYQKELLHYKNELNILKDNLNTQKNNNNNLKQEIEKIENSYNDFAKNCSFLLENSFANNEFALKLTGLNKIECINFLLKVDKNLLEELNKLYSSDSIDYDYYLNVGKKLFEFINNNYKNKEEYNHIVIYIKNILFLNKNKYRVAVPKLGEKYNSSMEDYNNKNNGIIIKVLNWGIDLFSSSGEVVNKFKPIVVTSNK